MVSKPLKKGHRLGKYKLIKRLGEGTFGEVWKAKDQVEGISVALKIPQADWITKEHRKIFEDEVKMVAKLDHHNIVKIKTADVIHGQFMIVTQCGVESLADRMERPKPLKFILSVISQILNALAYAHKRKIIHRDVKPENVILFEDGTVRLTDFGIAKICERTLVKGEGTGTIGYMAPEQAYGLTSYASDVFSVGVLFYEMLTGKLPPWPFEWPYPHHQNLTAKIPPAMIHVIKKSTSFNPKRRFVDAVIMEKSWMRAVKQWKKSQTKRKKKTKKRIPWQEYKIKVFSSLFRKKLDLKLSCNRCHKPVSEAMIFCPWCQTSELDFRKNTSLPSFCGRCKHGIHNDWRFCPWCFRSGFSKVSSKPSQDKRYTHSCTNPHCRKPMMAFMHYCPYCHKKVSRAWKEESLKGTCPQCHWSATKDYWDFCPWCGKKFKR